MRIFYERDLGNFNINDNVAPFLTQEITSDRVGWLKEARKALFLSTGEMAKRLNIARSSYLKIERSEKLGTIKLNTLRQAAEALDCEVVYALRPKKRKQFSAIIWEILFHEAINHPWVKSRPTPFKARAFAFIVKKKMSDARFRRQHGWSQKK